MTRGRRREHYQWNMDVWGEPGVGAEAELIAAIFALRDRLGLGAGDVRVGLNSRALLEETLRAGVLRDRPEVFPALCVAIDKLDKIGADARGRAADGAGRRHRAAGARRARRGRVAAARELRRSRRGSCRRTPARAPTSSASSSCSTPTACATRVELRRLDRARPGLLHRHRLRGLRRRAQAARDLRRRPLRPPARDARRPVRCRPPASASATP